MSGHSKWATIKRAKAATDAARGKIFTKRAKEIILASQQGGSDPDTNFTLRIAIDKAKAVNMPSDNIERAIKKGAGELKGDVIVSITYEGIGPGSCAILVNSQTDNTNRSLTEIRNIVDTKGGKLGAKGSVSWMFEEKGLIIVTPQKFEESEKYGKDGEYYDVDPEELLLEIMEIEGVEDVSIDSQEDGDMIEVVTDRTLLRDIHQRMLKEGFKIEEAELAQIPNERVKLSKEDGEKLDLLLEALDENDEVSSVWHNADYE